MVSEKLSMNPYLKIWISPRKVMREIVLTNPSRHLTFLYWLYGFPLLLNFCQNLSLGSTLSIILIFLLSFIFAPLAGIIGIHIISGFLFWTGKWIGGEASFKEIRAAVAWSNVTNIVNITVWVLLTLFFGRIVFIDAFSQMVFTGYQFVLISSFFLLQFIITIWSFIILLHCLGEVQGFSVWKSLLNVILFSLFLMVLFWLITTAIFFLWQSGSSHSTQALTVCYNLGCS